MLFGYSPSFSVSFGYNTVCLHHDKLSFDSLTFSAPFEIVGVKCSGNTPPLELTIINVNYLNYQFVLFDILSVWAFVIVLAQCSDCILVEQITRTSDPPRKIRSYSGVLQIRHLRGIRRISFRSLFSLHDSYSIITSMRPHSFESVWQLSFQRGLFPFVGDVICDSSNTRVLTVIFVVFINYQHDWIVITALNSFESHRCIFC